MASIAFTTYSKSITVSDGTQYGYVKVTPKPGKPLLLFLHGYPSSGFHWHTQVHQCITEGYGVIAPDLLGYGDTAKPTAMAAYDNTIMARHVLDILQHENASNVIGVGHDWGSIFLSTIARLYPNKFTHLIFLDVGYLPSQVIFLDIDAINAKAKQSIGRPIYGYWRFFNNPNAASLIESADFMSGSTLLYPADPNIWIANMCEPGAIDAWTREGKTTKLAPWISLDDLEVHKKIIQTGGFTGPLNWYKQAMAGITHRSEALISPDYDAMKFTIPTLFIGCAKDVICIPAMQEAGMKHLFSDLTTKTLDSGHWCMMEKPIELWEAMHEWIENRI